MAHEDLSRTEEIQGSSDRAFGIVFTVVFAIIAFWPLAAGGAPRLWALVCAAAMLAVALAAPRLLALPNRMWTRLGVLMGRLVSPVVIAILFYLVVTPFGVAMRLFRRDPLRLRYDPKAHSYWVEREPPGPDPAGMENQF